MEQSGFLSMMWLFAPEMVNIRGKLKYYLPTDVLLVTPHVLLVHHRYSCKQMLKHLLTVSPSFCERDYRIFYFLK